jgi:hypothetical protein
MIVEKENEESIRLLISLGGATTIAKVREEWPNVVRSLAKLIGTEMNSWADDDE